MKRHATAIALLLSSCGPTPAFAEVGIASFYSGKKSEGGMKTANGERLQLGALTAAHKTLPFGTRVRVTNRRNGRSIGVRINDRGPFIKGRIIDLTPAGARALAMDGITQVEITRVD